MSTPPRSIAEPPLSHSLKRKRGDSTVNPIESSLEPDTSTNTEVISEYSDVSGVSLDDDVLEDVADALAVSNDGNPLRLAYSPSEVQQRIRQYGIRRFVAEVISKTGLDARTLGASIGLKDVDMLNDEVYMFLLERVLVRLLTRRRKLAQYNTIDDAADLLRSSKKIMVVTGAGISTSLGIPDFRSKETGFYVKLKDMGFSEPEEVFDIHVFDENPEIFYGLAGEILPAGDAHTPTHAFIRLIQDKDKLQTNYTQNIDNLEANAGVDPAKLIQCHGSFATASCRKCKHKVPGTEIFGDIRAKEVAYCKRCLARIADEAKMPKPNKKPKKSWSESDDDDEDSNDGIPTPGVMKPDITFFGEQLPDNFFERFLQHDSTEADLVIVIGTSLKVAPVSEMPNHMPEHVPHIYISREACEHINFDIQLLGDCDKVVWELARRAGWQLSHEMIDKGLKLDVSEYNSSDHQWMVIDIPNDKPEQTATSDVA